VSSSNTYVCTQCIERKICLAHQCPKYVLKINVASENNMEIKFKRPMKKVLDGIKCTYVGNTSDNIRLMLSIKIKAYHFKTKHVLSR
jgi:hypothetical protein